MNISPIAACTFEIQSKGGAIQLFPAGAFKARDGRPNETASGHWLINDAIAARLIAKVVASATDLVIDYEHQTLNSAENGQPAPAAGWFHGLEWRAGDGLFAIDTRWTGRAKAMIEAGEYRYLSPVFSYDQQTGEVLDLHHVGLTNYPALDGMAALPALAAARFRHAHSHSDSEIVALKRDLTTPTTANVTSEVERVVQFGLTTGRLLPIQQHWARELGYSNLTALKGYLEKTVIIPARPPYQPKAHQGASTSNALSSEALAVCRALDISTEDYLATLKKAPSGPQKPVETPNDTQRQAHG